MSRISLLGLCLLLLLASPPVRADTLTQLDGQEIQARVIGITRQGEVTLEGTDRSVDLQNLRRIVRDDGSPAETPGAGRLFLLGDGHITAKSISLRDGTFEIGRGGDELWTLPIRHAAALRLTPDTEADRQAAERFQELRGRRLETDRVLARDKEQVQTVRCAVVSLDDQSLTVEYGGEERRIGRDRLFGLVLATTARAPDRAGHCFVTLRDGSEIPGELLALREGRVHLSPFPNQTVEIPWKEVVRIDVRSRRMVFLSDLEPVEVLQEAIVTYPWSYRRNENVLGGPLRLGDRKFDRGLGTHSRCHLTYAAEGKYSTLAAVIGIDDSTGDRGDCLFRVFGDGEKLFEQRARGSDAPRSITVDISGCRRVTLAVEPGEGLDVADNANWCDARFVAPPQSGGS